MHWHRAINCDTENKQLQKCQLQEGFDVKSVNELHRFTYKHFIAALCECADNENQIVGCPELLCKVTNCAGIATNFWIRIDTISSRNDLLARIHFFICNKSVDITKNIYFTHMKNI